MNTSQKELLTIYALSALFSGGRLFVGAISVLYVLSFGVTIGEFAMIKSIQIATFLLFDIPSGLLIKRIGFRKSILITFIFSISGLSLYALGSNFISFLLAEFILAISLCICPAAFTDYVMQFLNRHPNILVEKVFHRNEMYTNVSNVICGLLGGYLYTFEKTIPYTAGIFVQGIGLFFAFKMIPVTSQEDKRLQSIRSFIKSSLTGLRAAHMSIAMPIFLLFIIQLTVQPLYHYWQPLFYEINHNISGTILGLLFMSYSICAIVLNFIFSKLVHFEFFRSIRCVLFLLFISSGLYFLTSLTTNEMTAFLHLPAFKGFFSLH